MIRLQQATSNTGTAKKDITGKAITQLVASNKVATIECSNYELDADNAFTFLAMDVTTIGATAAVAAMLYGGPKGKYQPSTTISVEDIVQVITV